MVGTLAWQTREAGPKPACRLADAANLPRADHSPVVDHSSRHGLLGYLAPDANLPLKI